MENEYRTTAQSSFRQQETILSGLKIKKDKTDPLKTLERYSMYPLACQATCLVVDLVDSFTSMAMAAIR